MGEMRWGVVIAAGGLAQEPLLSAIGTPRKALAELSGKPSIAYVLDAVRGAGFRDVVVVSGADLAPAVGEARLIHEAGSAIDNVSAGADALPDADALLMLPSDAPLLDPRSLAHFREAIERRDVAAEARWYAAGLAPLESFRSAFPTVGTKAIRLREGRFLSGALYAASPQGLRHSLTALNALRHHRRSQLRMVRRLGLWNVARFLAGLVRIGEAERVIGRAFEGRAVIVPDCDPATCVDFDTPEELRSLREIMRGAPVAIRTPGTA